MTPPDTCDIVTFAMGDQVNIYVVKGLKYYSASAARARGALQVGARVVLEREPENPHDRNAVLFRLASSGEKLGHMSRDSAPWWSSNLQAGWGYKATVHRVSNGECRGDALMGNLRVEIRLERAGRTAVARESTEIDLPPRVSGVYLLRCDPLDRVYVGSSTDMRARARNHLADLTGGRHHNQPLQDDFASYGAAAFSFRVHRSFVPPDQLATAEVEAITALRESRVHLYNRTADGQGTLAGGSPSEVSTREHDWSASPERAEQSPRPSIAFKGTANTESGQFPVLPVAAAIGLLLLWLVMR